MQSAQSTHSSRFPSTISTRPSASVKMSTGQTSSSFAANSASPAIESSTSTAMNSPCSSFSATDSSPQLLLHNVGDLIDPLDHPDPGSLEAGDLLRCSVLGALDDRAGVPEAHPLH